MRGFLFIVFLWGMVGEGLAQGCFETILGSAGSYEEGYSIAPVNGNGYLVSGAFNQNGGAANWKSFLVRLNTTGDTLWTQKDLAFNGFMKPAQNGNFIYVGGEKAGFQNDSVYLTLASETGTLLWKTGFSFGICRNTGWDVTPTSDGGFAATGTYKKDNCAWGLFASFVIKVNAQGQTEWTQTIDNGVMDQLYSIRETANGNIALFGWTTGIGQGLRDYYLIVLSATGQKLWEKTYGDIEENYGYGMDIATDGGFLLFGYHEGMTNTLHLIKTDAQGQEQWSQTFGNACGSSYYKVLETKDGGIAILSQSNQNGNCVSRFARLSSTGTLLWDRWFDGRLRTLAEPQKDVFILTGYRDYLPNLYAVVIDSSSAEPVTTVPTGNQTQLSPVTIDGNELAEPTAILPDKGLLNPPAAQPDGNPFDPVSVEEPFSWFSRPVLLVYPNPAEGFVVFEFPNPAGDLFELEIFSLDGRLVRHHAGINGQIFRMERQTLADGLYTYLLKNRKGDVFAGKILFKK